MDIYGGVIVILFAQGIIALSVFTLEGVAMIAGVGAGIAALMVGGMFIFGGLWYLRNHGWSE